MAKAIFSIATARAVFRLPALNVFSEGDGKPVVNTEDTPLADQTPEGPDYTVEDVDIVYDNVTGEIRWAVDAYDLIGTIPLGPLISIPSGIDYEYRGHNVVLVDHDNGVFGLKLAIQVNVPMSGTYVQSIDPPLVVIQNSAFEEIARIEKSEYSFGWASGDVVDNIRAVISIDPQTIADTNLLDTIGGIIGTIIAGQDATAPDATAVLKNTLGNIQSTTLIKSDSSLDLIANDASVDLVDTAGNPLSTTSVPSNRSTQVTAPNGILRDSTPTDVNVKSNEVLVIADTDVTNSDNATVLYTAPKFNDVSLPSIRLTVGATNHDYETSEFSYASGVLSKNIDDIAGSTDGVLEASANCYQVQSYLETAPYHPFTVDGTATKSMAFWFKYDEARDGVSNITIVGNKTQGTSGRGLFVIHRNVDGNFTCGIRASGSQLLSVLLTTPAITIGAWNSFVITFSSKSASGMKVYLNKTLLAVDSITSDSWGGATPSSSTPWAFKAIYDTYPTALDTTQQDIDAKFADIQMYNGVLSQAQVDEFHDFPLKETPSYQASLAHRYLSKRQFTSGLVAVDEITGSFPFRVTNGSDGFNNTDTP